MHPRDACKDRPITHHRRRHNPLRPKRLENAREKRQLVKPVHKTHRAENEADGWWREVQAPSEASERVERR